jgi:hypothetical protein
MVVPCLSGFVAINRKVALLERASLPEEIIDDENRNIMQLE